MKIFTIQSKLVIALALSIIWCNIRSAEIFTTGGISYSSSDGTTATVIKAQDASERYRGDIVIPSTVKYNGKLYTVKGIGNNACQSSDELKSIKLPYGIEKIGSFAFDYCKGLTSIEIPNSVTYIGGWAFSGCSGLTSIKISTNVTEIGESAFSDCTNLTYVEIPSSVKSLGKQAFCGCEKLSTVLWDARSIGSLGSLNLIFKDCPIKTFTFGKNVTVIPSYCLYELNGVESIVIPSNVKKINESAVTGCNGLTSIEIPSTVNEVKRYAFGWCSNLTDVYWNSSTASIIYDVFKGSPVKKFIMGDNVRIVDSYCFSQMSSLTTVKLSSNLELIDRSVFGYCTGLTSIEIPKSVKEIKSEAFWGCSELTSVDIAPGVEKIGYAAFYSCTKLKSIKIPEGVKEIGNSAFDECESLSSVELSSTVTTIGDHAFYGCYKINTIKCYALVPPETETYSFVFRGKTVYVPCQSIEDYKKTRWIQSNLQCMYIDAIDETNANKKSLLKEDVSIIDNTILVKGVETSGIRIYNTAGKQVSNPVPASGVYVVKIGDEAVKVMVK